MSLRDAQRNGTTADNERLRRELERLVTERNALRAELSQSRALEAVGRQAVAVAHDLSNLVSMISGSSQTLLRRLATDERGLRASVEGIHRAAERGGVLARQLMAAYRAERVPAGLANLNDIVASAEPLLRLLVGEDHRLEVSLEPGLGLVSIDAGQIEHVLTNLVVNARDALERQGRVSIATANVELNAAGVGTLPGLAPGEYVVLTVSDNGRGIDPAVRARLFEPYVTTKGEGGTGLGLFTTHDMVQRAGGAIRVGSHERHGATFEVYLPRQAPPVVADDTPDGETAEAAGPTVLVVEDEAPVRDLIHDVLTLHGYSVLTAGDGVEALAVNQRHRGRIDVLIVDVVLPGITANEIVRAVAGRRAGVKTLYMSGYTDDLIRQHGLLRIGPDFLQKPFTVDALVGKVREVLDA